MSPIIKKSIFVILGILLAVFALLFSQGYFEEDPGYIEVPHGNHSHFVPHDRDPNVGVHDFPIRPPREGERITPTGEIVRVDTLRN